MKIIQINNCHYRRGGADVVYLNTTQLLLKKGHEVINFSQRTANDINLETKEYFINQIDFFKLSYLGKLLKTPRFFYSTEAKQKLEDLIIHERPDIAHIHTYKGTLTPSILIPLKKHNIPVVITLHDYGLLCPHNSFIDGKGRICEKCMTSNNAINCITNRCNRNNVLLSSISAFEFIFHKKFLPFENYFDGLISVSKFGEKLHKRKLEYINKVFHLYNFFPNLSATKENHKKGSYFLFYGRLSAEKGIMTLLKAWKNLNVDSVLKIVGDGPLMSDIKSFVTENKLLNVEILGFKKGEEINSLINNSSFIIVPSEWYENNPLTIIEAYANGRPVIAARSGGIPEIVIENKTGFTFEMANVAQLSSAITTASKMSETEYSIISKGAREFAEINFSEENHYKELMNIYDKTIQHKS